jgi:hypothetical protein
VPDSLTSTIEDLAFASKPSVRCLFRAIVLILELPDCGYLWGKVLSLLRGAIAWLGDLEIGLGIWEGMFEDVPGYWLRWCDEAGNWFLTDTEQAEAQLLQAARNLLATGIEIAQVAKILGLSEAQVQAIQSSH